METVTSQARLSPPLTASMWVLGIAAAMSSGLVDAAGCTASSGANRTALVELYTSEGCSDCPPADRWISQLPGTAPSARQVVPLAFHVNYWDGYGWKDAYSNPAFSQRQREAVARQSSRVVFTPQVLLNGKTVHNWRDSGQLSSSLAAINGAAPAADVSLAVTPIAQRQWQVKVSGAVKPPVAGAAVYVAAYENGLATEVQRGENSGKLLRHDFVVRQLIGPLVVGADGRFEHSRSIVLPADAQPAASGVAAFIQRGGDGDVLQVLSVAGCG